MSMGLDRVCYVRYETGTRHLARTKTRQMGRVLLAVDHGDILATA